MLEGGGSGMNTNANRGKPLGVFSSLFHVQLIGILTFLFPLGSSSPTSACGGIGLDSSDPLLPTSYGLTNGSSSPNGGIKEESNGPADGENGVVKANKGMILRKSVDYIRYDLF